MLVIDLFSGAGGLSRGFEEAGYNIVAANEWDPMIAETYKINHPNTVMFNEDIKDFADNLGRIKDLFQDNKVDVVIGGPPCQGFSMAGKRIRKSNQHDFMDDPRNYLFKQYFKVIKELSPDYFLFENVEGLKSMKNGGILEEISCIFTAEGYKLSIAVLNAKHYGIPQERKRLFILGSKHQLIDLEVETKEHHKKEVTLKGAISDLNYLNSGEGEDVGEYRFAPQSAYQQQRRAKAEKLHNHKATNHNAVALKRMSQLKPGQNREDLGETVKSVHSGAYGRLEWDKAAMTIHTRFDTPSGGRVIHPELDRTLTPREAARIQSFDDDFVFVGGRVSIATQIGNAVPPLLGETLAKIILNHAIQKE